MIANRSNPPPARRPGFGLVELAITGVLIAVAMTATVQVVGWIALERKAVERRERAVLEAANVLERAAALPWDELSTGSAARLELSKAAIEFLRGPSLDVKVTPLEDAPGRKKVVVEVRWPERSGRAESPVRLVAWVYRRGEAAR